MSVAAFDTEARALARDTLVRNLGKALEGRRDVRLALLFGSRARGCLKPHSDADVAVEADGVDLWTLAADLSLAVGMEVDARFHCPDPRSIVMTIVGGEGVGSVVETHVTPIQPGRTAVIEATLATSDRPQFWAAVRPLTWVFRGMVERRAHRLWVDDVAYSERRYALRNGE